MDKAKKVTSKKLDLERLSKGGGDLWTIMLDGSTEGIDYEYSIKKILSFTSQPTKKDPERFFNFATVMCEDGSVLNLPINTGLVETYYQDFIDEQGNLKDDHVCAIDIAFSVTIFENEKGKIIKDGQYDKKKVSQVVYSAN